MEHNIEIRIRTAAIYMWPRLVQMNSAAVFDYFSYEMSSLGQIDIHQHQGTQKKETQRK